MHPNLFSIGPVTIHTYGIFIAIGIFSAVILAMKLAERDGISLPVMSNICFLMIILGIIGARFVYVITNISYYMKNPLDIIQIWKGGLVFLGGLIFACTFVLWYIKRHGLDFWKIGDILAPCAALGMAIGRIGCFMAGCCYGKPTDYAWAVTFTDPCSLAPLNIPLHPTQIYHSLACLIIFFTLMILRKNKSFEGQVFLWYLILFSVQRLLIEKFRWDCRPILFDNMTMTQFISLVILMTAGISLIIRKRRLRK